MGTDLRDAARQALEALIWHDETVRTRGDDEAIEALRAALMEEALQRLTDANQEIEACASLTAQNAEQDRVLVEMEHALNEADAIMEEVSEETADAWRKRWGYLWGRKV